MVRFVQDLRDSDFLTSVTYCFYYLYFIFLPLSDFSDSEKNRIASLYYPLNLCYHIIGFIIYKNQRIEKKSYFNTGYFPMIFMIFHTVGHLAIQRCGRGYFKPEP